MKKHTIHEKDFPPLFELFWFKIQIMVNN